MLRSKWKNYLTTAFLSVGVFAGCGGGGSGGTISSDTTIGKIVDPYIVGAVLCEDINKNGICESNEQLSSTSTVDGQFTFSSPLTAGSHIIVKTHGLHNGLTYDLNISGVVDSAGEIEVVSPITTPIP